MEWGSESLQISFFQALGQPGFDPSVMVDSVGLILQGGGRSLEDLRGLKNEEGLMKLIGRDEIPEPDTVGDWLRRVGDPGIGRLD